MVGLGSDMVAVDRLAALLARHGDRFRTRCFRPAEIAAARARGGDEARDLAARWAAKEAFLKALGPAVSGVGMREIEVVRPRAGAVALRLHGAAREALRGLGVAGAFVSLVERDAIGAALVVLE